MNAGTIARGAAETGAVEAYMCARLMRHPLVRRFGGAVLWEGSRVMPVMHHPLARRSGSLQGSGSSARVAPHGHAEQSRSQ